MTIESPTVAKIISLLFALTAINAGKVPYGSKPTNIKSAITTTSKPADVVLTSKEATANLPSQSPAQSTKCFNPSVEVVVNDKTLKKGNVVELKTSGVKGGKDYGQVTYEWTALGGPIRITGNGKNSKLNVSSSRRGQVVTVRVEAKSQRGNCMATGEIRFALKSSDLILNEPPTVSLTVGNIYHGSNDLLRESTSTVCAGDKVDLRATASDPDGDALIYYWSSTSGRVTGDGANTLFDSTGLAPADYTITVQVDDGARGMAFDTKTIRVTNCPPLTVCFGPNLYLSIRPFSVRSGEKVDVSTDGLTGGRNYGGISYKWSASEGFIRGDGLRATLDTTGVRGGTTIEITVKAMSEIGNCFASGSGRTSIEMPPLPSLPNPMPREVGDCSANARNDFRLTGSCLGTLEQAVKELNADPGAMLLVQIYRLENERSDAELQRARVVSGKLQDGSLGAVIDPYRLRFKFIGVAGSYDPILRMSIYPYGAEPPDGEMVAAPISTQRPAPPKPTPPKPKPKGKATKRTGKGRN